MSPDCLIVCFVVFITISELLGLSKPAEIPVSTTHCQVGSVLGCGMAGGIKNIKWSLFTIVKENNYFCHLKKPY